jgi:integrase/recombinase XerD
VSGRKVKEKAVQEQVDQFLRYLKEEKGYSDNTIAAYRNDLRLFVTLLNQIAGEGPNSWAEVNQDLILGYSAYLEEQNYASSTVARKVASIKTFFSFLRNIGLVADDLTDVLNAPKVEKRRPRILSEEEVERLLAEPAKAITPKAQRDRALLSLLCATGMRVSEVITLQLEDLDIAEARIICVSRDGKERQLPLTPDAFKSLTSYLKKSRSAVLRGRREKTLFLNQRGYPLTRQGLWLIIKSYAEAAGIGSDVTPHTLRHSFAVHCLVQGSELQKVRELLGHANISTTQVYTDIVNSPGEGSEGGLERV